MQIGFFKMFSVAAIVGGWAEEAFADGRVTMQEALDLVSELGAVLGIDVLYALPGEEKSETAVELDSHLTVEGDPVLDEEGQDTRRLG